MPPWEKYRNNAGNGPGPVVVPLPRHPDDLAKEKRDSARSDRSEGRDEVRIDLSKDSSARDERRGAYADLMKMRDAFEGTPIVKEYRTTLPIYTAALKREPTGAGDNALIYDYAKIMDPGSVVRESEMQMAGSAGSVFDTAAAKLKKQFGIEGGGQLSDDVRQGLRKEMLTKITEMNRGYNSQRQRYRADANAFGFDPDRVIGVHDGRQFLPEIEKALTPPKQPQGESVQYSQEVPGGLTGSVTDESPPEDPINVPRPQGYQNSYVGQGMSGINQGIASTLGAPVDLMALGMNGAVSGINALTNSSIPRIDKPFLGSEQIGDTMKGWGVYGESQDPSKQFVRRMGQSVGAAFVPMAGTMGAYAQAPKLLGMAAAGGAGAAGAQQLFPNNPTAEFAGEVLGSGLGAGAIATGARRSAIKNAIKQVPSRDQLRDQATNLYNTAESRGIVAGPNVTTNLAERVRQIARDEELITPKGRVVSEYPRASGAMNLLDDYAGQTINPKQIQVVRRNLTDAVQGTEGNERRIAKEFLDAFDEETVPLAPELAQARKVSSRYLQSDEINRSRELAEPRAAQYSGAGMENALRTEFRRLDRNLVDDPKGFNPAASEAIRNVSRGTKMSNALRFLGKAAPTGVVSGGLSAGVPFYIGNSVGGPGLGAAASAATMGVGTLARAAAAKATQRQAEMADALARNGGALDTGPLLSPETEELLKRILGGQASQYIPRN